MSKQIEVYVFIFDKITLNSMHFRSAKGTCFFRVIEKPLHVLTGMIPKVPTIMNLLMTSNNNRI